MPALTEKVVQLIAGELAYRRKGRTASIALESQLVQDLEIDELDRVSITCALEETFDFECSDQVLLAWATVDDVVRTVRGLVH